MQIVTLGAEVLRGRAEPVLDINADIKALTERMIESMRIGRGIGLAAPQVGISKRIFVVGIDESAPLVFINPSLLETSMEMIEYEEGCLSVPGLYAKVSRPAYIRVQAWNERGRPFTLEADELLARVILHEYDHLEGILFIDHLNEKKRERLLKQYEIAQRA